MFKMHPLNPGVVFNFETTGPIAPTEMWTFNEFYSPEARKGSLTDKIRKVIALLLVNKLIQKGSINRGGVWEATVIRKGFDFTIRLRHMGDNIRLI